MNTRVKILMTLLGTLFLFTGEYTVAQHCFRGKPCPQCRWFWITEAGLFHRFDESNHPQGIDSWFLQKVLWSFDLGLMHNLDGYEALGASINAGYESLQSQGQLGARLHYRRWMRNPLSFEYAPGIIVNTEGRPHWGISNLFGITVADLVALTARIDIMKWSEESDYEVCTYGGITLGSYAGLTVGIAAALIISAALIAFAASS